jgi:hypothetical protein
VLADETGRGPAASATKVRLRWLAVVVTIMALLTAGWPLLNSIVSNRQPLAAGAKVTVGPGSTSSGTVTVGPGWSIEPEQSNPTQQYVLRNGAVVFEIRHVALVSRSQPAGTWLGMRGILAISNPGFRLGRPVTIMIFHVPGAITGRIYGPRLVGFATVVPGPSRNFAIAMVELAPRHTSRALLAAAHRIMVSLMFAAPSR